jgi:hypothetical protein
VTLGGVAMLRCFTLAKSPARACLPERRACNTEGPEALHLCAGPAHCQNCRGARAGRSLWRSLLLLRNGMEVGSQTVNMIACTAVGCRFQVVVGGGCGPLRLLTRSIPAAYVPSHRAMQRRHHVCTVACERKSGSARSAGPSFYSFLVCLL